MIELKDQRPIYPIGTIVEMTKPFGRLREGHVGVAVEHHEDGRVLFKFGDDHHTFPLDDLKYFLRIISPMTSAYQEVKEIVSERGLIREIERLQALVDELAMAHDLLINNYLAKEGSISVCRFCRGFDRIPAEIGHAMWCPVPWARLALKKAREGR